MEQRIITKFPDYTITEDGVIYDNNNNIVKTFINAAGYVSAVLNDRILTVAYLVAKTWLKNDNKCICVGYKDNDYSNIKASNLYWYYEGEEQLEDKSIILVDTEGEIRQYFSSLTKCCEYYDCSQTTIIQKCRFTNKNVTSPFYFFFEDEFSEEELKQRVEYRQYRLEQIELNKQQAAVNRALKYNITPKLKPVSIPILEVDINGNIVAEYSGKYQLMEELKWSYPKMQRIIERDSLYNNHYFLLKSDYKKINILDFIRIINEREKRKEEEKQRLIQQKKLNEQRKLERKQNAQLSEQKRLEKEQRKQQRQEERRRKQEEIKEQKRLNKVVVLIDIDGNIINEYTNIKQSEKELNITGGSQIVRQHYLIQHKYLLVKKKDYNKEIFEEELKKYFFNRRIIGKAIVMIDEEGNVIKEYKDTKEASKETGINYFLIHQNLSGKSKTTKGFRFRYKED